MPRAQSASRPIVRHARAADVARICLIHNEAIESNTATMQEEPTSPESAQRLIDDCRGRSSLLVVEYEGEVCGWGRVWPYSIREGYRFAAETAIFIARASRRRGLGTLLQTALIEESRRLNYHHLAAKVFADNAASIHLHVKLGYEVVGIQREIGLKNGRWKDVAILQYVHGDE